MSLVVRAALVVAAALVATVGCDSVFRFDEPASRDAGDGNDGGSTLDGSGADAAASHACTSDTTCAGLHCQTSTGRCVACVADGDCTGARRHCDVAKGVCVECSADECGLGQRCNAATKRCLDTCFDDDDPCPLPGFVCAADLKLCIECRQSENCVDPKMPLCDVPIGRCVECTGNARCPASKPVCDRRTGKCVGCLASEECGAGAACDPVSSTCIALP